MAKAYIISKGDYSDYTVWGVYSDEGIAKGMLALLNSEDTKGYHGWNDLEEYDMDVLTVPEHPWRRIQMDVDGNTNDNGDVAVVSLADIDDVDDSVHEFYRHGRPYKYFTYVMADTQERAVKIANDRRIAFIASEVNGEREGS